MFNFKSNENPLALWRHRQSDAKWRGEVQSLYSSLREMLKETGQKQTRACLLSDVEHHVKLMEDEIRNLSSTMGLPTNDSFKEEFLEVLKNEEEIWRKEKTEKKKESREKQKKVEASLQIRPNLRKKTIKIVHPTSNQHKKERLFKPGKSSPKVEPLNSNLQNKKNFYLSLPKKTPHPNSVNYIYLEIVNTQNSDQKSITISNKKIETKKGIFVPLLKESNKEVPAKKCKMAIETTDPITTSKCQKLKQSSSVCHYQNQSGISKVQNKNTDGNDFVKERAQDNGNVMAARIAKEPKRRRKIQHPQKCLPFEDEYMDSSDGFYSISMHKEDIYDNTINTITPSSCSLKLPVSVEKEPQLPVLVDDMLLTPPKPPTGKSENLEPELHLFQSDFFATLETLPSCPKEMDYECETSVYNLLRDIMSEK